MMGITNCFVSEDTRLPMMYIDDAIMATEMIMQADGSRLGTSRAGYNIRGCSFTAGELADRISLRIRNSHVISIPISDRRLPTLGQMMLMIIQLRMIGAGRLISIWIEWWTKC